MLVTQPTQQTVQPQQPGQQAKPMSAKERAIQKLLGDKPSPESPKEDLKAALANADKEDMPLPSSSEPSEPTLEAPTSTEESEPNVELSDALEETKADDKPKEQDEPQKILQLKIEFEKKERALKSQISKLKEEMQAAKLAAEQGTKPTFDESKYISKDKLKESTLEILLENGIEYDQITEQYLTQQQAYTDPRIKAALAKLEAETSKIKEEQEKFHKSREEEKTQQYQQAINQIRSEVKSTVAQEAEEYELISGTESEESVVSYIEETFKAEGRVPSVKEACQHVEESLSQEFEKLLKLNKLKNKFSKINELKPSTQAQPKQQTSAKSPTLTSAMTVQKPLSARERAIAVMQGKLNK